MHKKAIQSLYVGPFRIPAYAPALIAIGALIILVAGFVTGYFYCDSKKPDIFSSPTSLPKLNVCFSPEGRCENMATHAINSAKHTIYVRAYSFTAQPIANALIAAHKRGVIVKILVDKNQLKEKNAKIRDLKAKGILVKIESVDGLAHNKVLVIDEKMIISGSYDWSKSANKRNAENMLAINDPELAKSYIQNWLNAETRSYDFK